MNNSEELGPRTQELNLKPTGQPYKLTFYYESDKKPRNSNHPGTQGDFDGFVVQSFDNEVETNSKAAR